MYLFPFPTLDWQLARTLTEDLLTMKTGRLVKQKLKAKNEKKLSVEKKTSFVVLPNSCLKKHTVALKVTN